MKKFKVKIDKEKCIGCGSCVSICDNFYIKNGKANVKKEIINEEEYDKNLEAAELCPTNAITIEEIKKEIKKHKK
ncbi:MAG: ferredoxin [Candidatus Pacearchaeota archaeon]